MRAGYWLFVLVCWLLAGREAMAFWWLFSGAAIEPTDGEAADGGAVERRPVSFEMASAEQKFLSEAQQYLDLPPLEACQYRVVAELRRSCGELKEDELGKLSVALLNCQSQTENRPTFQCTRDMTLAGCTAGMDAHVWNTYHIISNRARSVCYATRQQQFRRQTEAVVNQLSLSTLDQLKAMNDLSSQQSEVKQLASSSLETLHDFQRQSVARDQELEERQEGMTEKISHNLEQLAREKVLIHSGQQLLANMTGDIKRQLEVASDMLGSQEHSMRESRKEIIDDITTVQQNIQQVWGRIDNSTTQLLSVLEEISSHYRSTLESLQVINESLVGMQAMVEGMRSAVTSQLDWVVGQLGGANQGLRVLSVCASHTLFLLVSTLCVVFVRAPGAARAFLLLSVVGNAVLDLKTSTSLTFTALAALETAAVVLNWLWLSRKERKSNPTIPPYLLPPHPLPPSHPPPTTFDDSLDGAPFLVAEETEEEEEGLLMKPCQPTPPVALRNLTPHFRAAETLSSTPTKSHRHHPHPSHPPLSSHRCSAFTHSGIRCRLRAVAGSSQCHRHDNQ